MLSKPKLLAVAFLIVLVSLFYMGHKIYDYGYSQGQSVCETYYKSQLESVKKAQEKEQQRVSLLEQQLFESSKKYEQLNVKLNNTKRDNEKWKTQSAEAKKESLGASSVKRLNAILDAYSSHQ